VQNKWLLSSEHWELLNVFRALGAAQCFQSDFVSAFRKSTVMTSGLLLLHTLISRQTSVGMSGQ
jgi:hypothetical protein